MVDEETGLGLLDVESALEMGDEFVPVEAEEKIMPQEKKLDTYDTEGIVTGCWAETKHKELVQSQTVKNALTSAELGFVVTAAGLVDTYCATSRYDQTGQATYNPRYGLLHGQHNYVAMLKFLYKTAKMAPNSGVTLADRHQAKQFLNNISVTHSYDVSYGDQDIEDMRNLVADIFSNKHGVEIVKKTGADTKKERAWILMGVAAHLLGDIYAHRTMMPGTLNATKDMDSGDFNDWKSFKDKVYYSTIEFRDIKMYMKEKDNKKYEDNVNFYAGRYGASGIAVKNLLIAYKKGDSFGVKKIIMEGTESYMNSSASTKMNLNNFQNYTWSSGSTDDVTSMSTGNYRANIVNGGVKLNEWDYVDYDHYVY